VYQNLISIQSELSQDLISRGSGLNQIWIRM